MEACWWNMPKLHRWHMLRTGRGAKQHHQCLLSTYRLMSICCHLSCQGFIIVMALSLLLFRKSIATASLLKMPEDVINNQWLLINTLLNINNCSYFNYSKSVVVVSIIKLSLLRHQSNLLLGVIWLWHCLLGECLWRRRVS